MRGRILALAWVGLLLSCFAPLGAADVWLSNGSVVGGGSGLQAESDTLETVRLRGSVMSGEFGITNSGAFHYLTEASDGYTALGGYSVIRDVSSSPFTDTWIDSGGTGVVSVAQIKKWDRTSTDASAATNFIGTNVFASTALQSETQTLVSVLSMGGAAPTNRITLASTVHTNISAPDLFTIYTTNQYGILLSESPSKLWELAINDVGGLEKVTGAKVRSWDTAVSRLAVVSNQLTGFSSLVTNALTVTNFQAEQTLCEVTLTNAALGVYDIFASYFSESGLTEPLATEFKFKIDGVEVSVPESNSGEAGRSFFWASAERITNSTSTIAVTVTGLEEDEPGDTTTYIKRFIRARWLSP